MTKKCFGFLLTLCIVIGLIPCTVLAADTHTVKVIAGAGGEVSADGTSWSDTVSVSVADGETIGSSLQYRAKEGYALDGITSLVNIVAVAAGEMHTVILDDQGRVYTCGYNYYGQRGVGVSTNPYPTGADKKWQFLRVTNGIDENTKIIAIAAGYKHTVLLDEDGNVYTAGYNEFGQLGRSISPATKVKTYGDISFGKVTVGDGSVKIKAIAAGQNHTILIDESGKVWTAGANGTFSQTYQLGRSPENGAKYDATFRQVTGNVNDVVIVAAAAGNTHTLLLDNDGNVWAAGSNSSGEAGFNYRNDSSKKEFTKCTIPGSPKITAIAAGSDHSVLLDESGNVYAAGSNLGQKQGNTGIGTCGQLGKDEYIYGTTSFSKVAGAIDGKKIVSVSAGEKYTIVVDENGAVYATGLNSTGQLGMSTETWNQPGFTQISEGIGNATIVSAEAGKIHTILLGSEGKIWSAGSNQSTYYALGQNITSQNCTTFALAVDSPDLQGKIDLNTFKVTGDRTINISFKAKTKIKVYYNCVGGSWVSGFTPESYYYKEDNTFAPPAPDKVIKNGYTPIGWIKTTYGNSETYTMKWEPKSGFTVHYDTKGGTAVADKTNVTWTDTVLSGITESTREGWDFLGWQYNDQTVSSINTYSDLAKNDTTTEITLTAIWRDADAPSIIGLENGFTYCGSVSFTVTDNGTLASVKAGNTALTPDMNGVYTLPAAKGVQTVTATDMEGNSISMTVTVNATHTYSKWENNGEKYWQKCDFCDHETAKKDIPTITVTGRDRVCRSQDYTFSFTLPEGVVSAQAGYGFTLVGSDVPLTEENGVYTGVVKAEWYDENESSFVLTVYVKTADGFEFPVEKTVAIQNEHSGGTATCTEQATCEICGEKYGDLKPHSYSPDWSTSEANHWHECTECGAKTDEAKHIDTDKNHMCDVCEKVLSKCADNDQDHKCDLCGKALSEHTGGTATCTAQAVCDVCGESYGELDGNNHTDLQHIPAVAATKTAEGNIEYWYCEGCGKYFANKDGNKEITKADTVTAKLPDDSKSPQTGDNSNLTLWIALLFISGGAVTVTTVYGRKKKRSVK